MHATMTCQLQGFTVRCRSRDCKQMAPVDTGLCLAAGDLADGGGAASMTVGRLWLRRDGPVTGRRVLSLQCHCSVPAMTLDIALRPVADWC